MSYRVLYRKYRPDSFDNLIGQRPIVEILKKKVLILVRVVKFYM